MIKPLPPSHLCLPAPMHPTMRSGLKKSIQASAAKRRTCVQDHTCIAQLLPVAREPGSQGVSIPRLRFCGLTLPHQGTPLPLALSQLLRGHMQRDLRNAFTLSPFHLYLHTSMRLPSSQTLPSGSLMAKFCKITGQNAIRQHPKYIIINQRTCG